MEPARGSRRLRSWSLLFLLLAASHSWSGVRGQEELQVLQPKDHVSVAEGETVVLNCTVPGIPPPGPVRWFKGKEPQRQEIYNFKGGSHPRIKPVALRSSNSDFSISISHITPEDSGTYYCVKFKRNFQDPDTELKSGEGTMLSVTAKPSVPMVSGPQERVNVEHLENFTCNSTGFSPKTITLKWFKNGNEIPARRIKVFPEGDSVSYNITSDVQVKLEASDVHSEVICEVNHSTLQTPLRGTKNLSDIIRVVPKVNISSQPLSLNGTNVTCQVKNFYPQNVSVIWLENGTELEKGKTSEPTKNKDGTYSLNISLLVNTSGQKEAQEITCQVLHDSQLPINASKTFRAPAPSGTMDKKESEPGSQNIFIAVGIVCILLAALLIATIYLIRAKQKKAKGSTSSTRLHEPEKNARDLSQIQEANDINNDITYADLNLPRGKKSAPRPVETNSQTEYASIQTGPSPQREDTLTYADLDMVHLNRSSKKPTTRPEESYSEYASVQVQRK
ncbi:tyrosine-protein phosphatase non-receptor type substrate 1-like isoform X1 [Antechinus flavipes]|uniref:tyrosine-protein phosphatase non-receptor type substrate 1-like isoform X1 n=1 Tax=Antechinus flavipes TaxID=38775 RepID=UPI002235BDD2|nr:tyrosine-protein phosphatase non-receptor type substrate 1-like isoform X1 [Antechinus flavipes]XP_051835930.1 tyrosine-protein phosphatase non-receptor type substrate 1-like isoform X1 [Antechinus flavipes]XP_051835931.1 tyrosine-protein phosphatase non-receptor type substrate 1-like isoform X1 [Antechinus flavipes]XP_051835932.1 tyrosine-protein phosphatase non-receptor type substrate 1-like isoform X1 [Antechinus flavipes]